MEYVSEEAWPLSTSTWHRLHCCFCTTASEPIHFLARIMNSCNALYTTPTDHCGSQTAKLIMDSLNPWGTIPLFLIPHSIVSAIPLVSRWQHRHFKGLCHPWISYKIRAQDGGLLLYWQWSWVTIMSSWPAREMLHSSTGYPSKISALFNPGIELWGGLLVPGRCQVRFTFRKPSIVSGIQGAARWVIQDLM